MSVKPDASITTVPQDQDDLDWKRCCRFCKQEIRELPIDLCPHCHKPFESLTNYRFRQTANWTIVLGGIYIWQKVLIGC